MNKRKIIIIILVTLIVIFLILGIILYFRKGDNNTNTVIENNKSNTINYNIDVESCFTNSDGLNFIVNVKKDLIKEGDIIRAITSDNKMIDIKVNTIKFLPNYSSDTIRIELRTDKNILDYDLIKDYKKMTTDNITFLDYYKETISTLNCKIYTKEEGGRHTPFYSKFKPIVNINNKEYDTIIYVLEKDNAVPGEEAKLSMVIAEKVNIINDQELLLKESNKNIATCKVLDSKVKTYKYVNDSYIFE